MKRAVLAVDTNRDYVFFLPIACQAWRKLGWRPLVLLVGKPEAWLAAPDLALAVHRARETGAEIHWLGDFEGVRTSTVAQCARIYAYAASGVNDEDVLITSDVDMLPIGSWVGCGDPEQALHIYYANAYAGSDYVHFPMCYLAARASTWRNIVNPGRQKDVRGLLLDLLADAPMDENGAWNFDERALGLLIETWARTDDWQSVRCIDRTFVQGEWRIDRSDWDGAMAEVKKRGNLDGVADAHLIRPGHTDENWVRFRPLLEMLFSAKEMSWIDDYRARWFGLENSVE